MRLDPHQDVADEDFERMENRPGGGGAGVIAWLLLSSVVAVIAGCVVWRMS